VRHGGKAFLFLITFTSVISVFLIFIFIIREAFPFFIQPTFKASFERIAEFFTSASWYPSAPKPQYGALSLIVGSLYVTAGALLFAVPAGLLAAMFLSDIAPFGLRQICKPVIELLAAIPSVAYGFFAVLVVAPWLQNNLGFSTGTNALNASIMLAIMAIPTIVSVADDAMTATGRQVREASYALGATRAETLIKVVMPAAYSGIIAAVILGMMRAIGETMVVWMAAGNASQIPTPWWNLASAVRTMTATIAGDMGSRWGLCFWRLLLFSIWSASIFSLRLKKSAEADANEIVAANAYRQGFHECLGDQYYIDGRGIVRDTWPDDI
jgi:phosphate transport system permease protein